MEVVDEVWTGIAAADAELEIFDEDDLLEQFAEVDKARAVVAAAPGAFLHDFKTRLLPADATVERFGQRHDAVQGYAANALSVNYD